MATWRELITEEMECCGESWENLYLCTLGNTELDVEFDNGYGESNGEPFLLWTKKRVYFPVTYDGSEWVSSVPRAPRWICRGDCGGHFGEE